MKPLLRIAFPTTRVPTFLNSKENDMAEDPLGSPWKTLDRDLSRISQLEMATTYVARPMVGIGIAFAFILLAFLIAIIWFGGSEGSLIVAAAAADFEASAEGLAGKRIGLQRGSTHQCYAEKMYPDAEFITIHPENYLDFIT